MWTGKARHLATLAVLLSAGTVCAQDREEEPLSAIDWLSSSVTTPAAMPAAPRAPAEPAVATEITRQPISILPLDRASLDALGITPPSRSGFPADLWGRSPAATLSALVSAERLDALPALQSLLYALLLAELNPPVDSDARGLLYMARVDKLLDLGALDQARALLELAETPEPEIFRRRFDIALLTGLEDEACETMRKTPGIAPTFPARVFCLARGGDWNAAALSLRTGETLGYIDADMSALLERFLDPELFEGEPDLPIPARPSPLDLRLLEAIGQPLSTTTLPVAFAQSDLRSNAGWKTRLEAAERLARTGAVEPNRLFGLYFERKPAASGGVWERVAAVQDLDEAIEAGDADAAASALQAAWRQMVEAELEVPFAEHFTPRIGKLLAGGPGADLMFRIGLLTEGFEKVARARDPKGAEEAFLIGLARGEPGGTTPTDQMGVALAAAFAEGAALPSQFASLLAEGRAGEALLIATDGITNGARGNLRQVTDGIILLREIGLETAARRVALELVLLERRG